ncbi:MAG TPA: hypothetical protein PKM72_09820 [Nitrospirales bacterium]|nr:hypothetical protein [Nitrospirales bacterium]
MHSLGEYLFRKFGILFLGFFLIGGIPPSSAQPLQEVKVTIEGYTFQTTQMPLQLDTETIIYITNKDTVRHDFGSDMFLHTLTHVDSNGVITYGKGVEGVLLEPGQAASIHLMLNHSGRFQFQCSIHKEMKGEILLLTVDAV